MVSLSLKTNNQHLINYLISNISKIELENIVFVKRIFSKYTNIILHYLGDTVSIFYDKIAIVLGNCIIDNYEDYIIHNLLSQNYFYFDNEDIRSIKSLCNMILSENFNISTNNILINNSAIYNLTEDININNRKKLLYNDMLKYIYNNKAIFLDGLIPFRINSYLNSLDEFVDLAVSQFVVNREYSEFIELLKVYIHSKPPQIDLVHLIYINEESILLDNNKNIIALTRNNLDSQYLSDISFSSNDYALNSLLSLLPRKIILHLVSPNDDFINTLKLIFEDSLSICVDCDICKTYKILNKQQNL